MAITNRAGARLSYEDVGSGAPPIVFVNGVGTHEDSRPQIAPFARRHRVVAPDLPGHGQSDAPERDYNVVAFRRRHRLAVRSARAP